MQVADAVQLISGAAIPRDVSAVWADLGCGSGVFTRALASLLPEQSTIYAIDKQRQNISYNTHPSVTIEFLQADFEKDELALPTLQGILMANALHYVADKKSLLERLQKKINKKGIFIMVEYDTMKANPWVPYPIDFLHLKQLFMALGFQQVIKLGERPSMYGQKNLYAAMCQLN